MDLKIMATAPQPAVSWRPQTQEYQDQHFSRDRAISHGSLWLCLSSLSADFINPYSSFIFLSSVLNFKTERKNLGLKFSHS
ncbi:MAG: hypothetical protein GTO17_06625 [Candidatus Aminicenantes bacterium]|nr:hypothetical protein [Candidatus Aminicenantes bacterium]